MSLALQPALQAPLSATTPVGKVRATLDGELVAIGDLYPLADVAEGGFFRRGWDAAMALFD